jgi:hypothetical protein
MKNTQILGSTIISILLFGALDSNAQQVREMQPLEAHDFECLQSLECVQSSQSLKSKGWVFIFDETVDDLARELTAKMKSKHISFFATYDELGDVLRSKYKRENVALPRCLLKHLAEGTYKGWEITRSEMMVKNLDPTSIKYKVKLKNNTSTKSEVFDFKFINDLHLKHGGLGKYHRQM